MPERSLTGTGGSSRYRVQRSVFLSQLLLAGATLVLVVVAMVVRPLTLFSPPYFFGVVLIFFTTGLAAAVPWNRVAKGWIALLPILDILAIALLRQADPLLGTSLLFVFPVIWMSTHFRLRGAVASVALSSVLVWAGATVDIIRSGGGDMLTLAVVPITLTFVATTTYSTTRRAAAQRDLLTHQSGLFETALQRSRRQERTLDEIFNSVDFGVVGFDGMARPTFINRAQREMLARFSPDSGQAAGIVVYMDDRVTPYPEHDRPYQRAVRGESIDRVTVWLGEPGTQQAAHLVSARPILDDNGDFDGGVMVSRDVTAEIRAIQARDDLVASVSHELRTPLTSILGFLELALEDDRVDRSTREMLGIASSNADRLLAIVAELLTTASDTKHALMLVYATCELSAIVTDAIESLRPLAAERGITFEVNELAAVTVQADAFRLRQVADNVLSNAIKYNAASGRITVGLRRADATAELQVTDTGRGMTSDEQRSLFDRFYRADSARGSDVHGTGLGLSISRDIMRQHGGDLRLESAEGRGTTVTFTLPIGR